MWESNYANWYLQHTSGTVWVTVLYNIWLSSFLTIKPTRRTNFSNLFWKWNSTYFGQFLCPSLEVIHCTQSNGMCHTDSCRAGSGWILILLESSLRTRMTYIIVECTMNNSWWWTEELSETCRVSFQRKFEKLVHLVGFIIRKLVTMHGHMNVKYITISVPISSFFNNVKSTQRPLHHFLWLRKSTRPLRKHYTYVIRAICWAMLPSDTHVDPHLFRFGLFRFDTV
jgi:hypothetical protein